MTRRAASSRIPATVLIAAFATLAWAPAGALEYRLQFAPVGNYKDLVVAGYEFSGTNVVGNCSYTRVTSGSGRGGHTIYTPVPETCTWDRTGTLLQSQAGAPVVPAPVAYVGTETIYAMPSSTQFTGYDSALAGGFVFTWGSHYTWLTSNAYLVLPQQPYTFTATLRSDGDTALDVSAVTASNTLAHTTFKIVSTTCIGLVPVGGTCDVTATYNDRKVSTPSGLAYDTFTLHLTTDAPQTNDFVQGVTDEVKVGGG